MVRDQASNVRWRLRVEDPPIFVVSLSVLNKSENALVFLVRNKEFSKLMENSLIMESNWQDTRTGPLYSVGLFQIVVSPTLTVPLRCREFVNKVTPFYPNKDEDLAYLRF